MDAWKANREGEAPELLPAYLDHIGRGALLTHTQEIDLACKAHSDDERARSRLIERNLRLVVSVTKKYRIDPYPVGGSVALEHLANAVL